MFVNEGGATWIVLQCALNKPVYLGFSAEPFQAHTAHVCQARHVIAHWISVRYRIVSCLPDLLYSDLVISLALFS